MEYLVKLFRSNSIKDFEDLRDMIGNTQLLLDLNIIDFSILRELCLYLNINESKDMLQAMVNQLYLVFKDKLEQYEKNMNFNNFSILLNYSVFFMILLINLKNNKTFLLLVFDKDSKLIKILMNVIKYTKSFEKSHRIAKILCNLFLDEYKEIYFCNNNISLEELFIINNEKFSKINTEGLDVYPKQIYIRILANILKIDLNYEIIFDQNLQSKVEEIEVTNIDEQYNVVIDNENINSNDKKKSLKRSLSQRITFLDDEKPIVKLQFIQSLIRVVISKEKYIYIDDNDLECYEYDFMLHVVNKCVTDTKYKYGDNYACLFRKDDLYEDIIKYFFFIFGNSLLIKSFITPLRKSLPIFEKNEDSIDKDEFLSFFDNIIKSISSFMPSILKVLLKIVYEKVNEIFTIDKSNYAPMFTLLFFNFFISPRVQEIHNFSPVKINSVRTLNRIIRNICYNAKFEEKDDLSVFNDIIEVCNQMIRETMENILSFADNKEEAVNSLKEFTMDKYLKYPKFLFYFDCSFISYIFKNSSKDPVSINEILKQK